MLALLASCHEASQLNWLVTDSRGCLVRSTQNCAASDSRFKMHCETAAAATCGHMKQPTRNVYVGCFMWRTMWRLIALCFASRPIESRYIWRSVTRSATENGPQGAWKGASMHLDLPRLCVWVGYSIHPPRRRRFQSVRCISGSIVKMTHAKVDQRTQGDDRARRRSHRSETLASPDQIRQTRTA